jgi:hypothetical protein
MPDLNKLYLFRMTHIENILHILKNGITHITSVNSNPNFIPIGDNTLIATRNDFILDNGRRLGEYMPFYFATRTPMLYTIQHGFNMVNRILPENIVYCVSSVQKIIDHQLDFVFTDGHAVDKFTTQYTLADIQNIDAILDKKAIQAKYWKDENDLDLKRRKEAEFLVFGDVVLSAVLGFLVFNENAKNRLISFGANTDKVHIKSDYYF